MHAHVTRCSRRDPDGVSVFARVSFALHPTWRISIGREQLTKQRTFWLHTARSGQRTAHSRRGAWDESPGVDSPHLDEVGASPQICCKSDCCATHQGGKQVHLHCVGIRDDRDDRCSLQPQHRRSVRPLEDKVVHMCECSGP